MRAKKVDTTHGPIRDYLRAVGFGVFSTHVVGGNAPDLVIAYDGFATLVECKTRGRGLKTGQKKFRDEWPGAVIVGFTPEQVEADYWLARNEFLRKAHANATK